MCINAYFCAHFKNYHVRQNETYFFRNLYYTSVFNLLHLLLFSNG